MFEEFEFIYEWKIVKFFSFCVIVGVILVDVFEEDIEMLCIFSSYIGIGF